MIKAGIETGVAYICLLPGSSDMENGVISGSQIL